MILVIATVRELSESQHLEVVVTNAECAPANDRERIAASLLRHHLRCASDVITRTEQPAPKNKVPTFMEQHMALYDLELNDDD